MPLIYDDISLLKSLLEAGDRSIQKKGQTQAQPATPEQLATFTLAKKMSQQLMRKIEPTSAPPANSPVGTANGATPALDRTNLETLGDFLQWAADNQVTWDGKRVAWVLGPGEAAPPGAWKFRTYKMDRTRDVYDRTAVEVPAYADKDALVKLISYLRDSQEAKNEKVFSVMLGRLVAQTNQFLEKNEQIAPRAEEKPADVFNPDDVVDGFSSINVGAKDPYVYIQEYLKQTNVNAIPIPLKWKNISSKAALIDWMSDMKFTGGSGEAVTPTAPDVDPCGMIHLLYLRAKYLSQYGTDRLRPGLSNLEQAYLKQITTLGPQFEFNGKACAVTVPGHVGPEKPNQPTQPGQGGGLSNATPAVIAQLSALKPFNSQFISFGEIDEFLKQYGPYANDPNVAQMISKLQFSIQKFRGETQMGSDTLQLSNMTTEQFKRMLKDPARAYIAASDLYDIVFYAGQLYQRLVTSLQTLAKDPVRGKYIDYRGMQQQVTPGGPQLTNVEDINELMYNLKQEWNHK